MAGPDVAVRARSADMVAVASVLCMLATGLQMTRPSLMTAITQDLPTCLGLRPLSATPGSLAAGNDDFGREPFENGARVQGTASTDSACKHLTAGTLSPSFPHLSAVCE